jgi:mono/diheme cytochrome c family protein
MVMLALIGSLFLFTSVSPVLAQEEGTEAEATSETLQQGAEVFRTVCAACHGPTGAGVSELFPPLRDNPRVLDSAYVALVVREGLSGPIEVNGITYDRVMPPPAGLSGAEVEAVAAFVAAGMEIPEGIGPAPASGAGTVAIALPAATVVSFGLAFLITAAVAAAVLAPKLLATTDRLTLPWFDAWLKTAVIVVYFIVTTVVVPSLILELGPVASLPRLVQDLIGVAAWGVALGLGLGGLWWAQRRSRV